MASRGISVYGCGPDEAASFRAIAPRFGVVPTITDEAVSVSNVDLARGNRCISVGHKARLAPPVLRELSRAGVAYVSTRSAGYDHIDVDFARSVGITVGNVAYSPDSVADYTLMLLLMLARDTRSVLRRADAHDFRLGAARGRDLRDLTVGVVGTGRIGTAVVARLRGFGSRVLTHDRGPATGTEHVPLDDLLRESDAVTLHTPLTPETHHLLDRGRLARMKRGAFVVNTGRGALLDTAALADALESGALGGAALDVLEGEDGVFYADHRGSRLEFPLLARLQRLPNVIVTPHTAFYTERALDDTVENTILTCLAFEGISA
ncbi:NAD(P)-dependent oxidoreductase [Microbacterium sp. X-17]|uniref:NAD(P)-dependent oxidoreductase n=1 Tax=Microbacterium sp. X-17 TaxID=3144404 RepID=UPI0031F5A0EB